MAAELEVVDGSTGGNSDGSTAGGADNAPVVVVRKVATSDVERQRFAHEATMLQRAAHPGVVEFISFDAETCTLRTQFVSDRTWQSEPPTTLASLAKGIAALASTLKDLHDLAITHGNVNLDHILLGPGDRPVLCDFSQADDRDPSIDVAALGEVVIACLEAIDEGRPATRKALSSLAARATHQEPSRRPTAAALAAAAAQLVEEPERSRPTFSPRTRVLTGAGVLVAAVAVLLWPGGDRPLPIATLDDAIATGEPPAIEQPASPAAPDSSTSPPTVPTLPTTAALTPDRVDSPEPLVLEFEGFRYAVGRVGDSAVIGDWDCDGAATAAVLRPHSGKVHLFPSWPGDQEEATVTPLTIPNSTARLEAAPQCGELVLVDAAGEAITLRVDGAELRADS